MTPKNCNFCKGDLQEDTTEFIGRIKDQVVIISNIPALVCTQCQEAYYTPKTSREIDKIMKQAHEGHFIAKPVAAGIINFPDLVSSENTT